METNTSTPAAGVESTTAGTIESAVAAHPFLQKLTTEALRLLASNAMLVRYNAGEWIFRQNEPANRFYLIQRGKVALEASRKDGTRVVVQTIGPDDVLGWSWLFAPYLWQFDARVVEPVEAIFFYGTRLREQCEENNALGYELMKRMVSAVVQRLLSARRELLTS
jgi:CRP-like cAMP-binding protein